MGTQVGFFPGTFDPPTKGHLQLINRAALLFDRLIVGVGENISKAQPILTVDERVRALKKETNPLENVEVRSYRGLTSTYAKTMHATVLIRGLRSSSDLEYEKQMALANLMLGIDTIFLLADASISSISSSLIRQLAAGGAPLSAYVPEELEELLHTRLKGSK